MPTKAQASKATGLGRRTKTYEFRPAANRRGPTHIYDAVNEDALKKLVSSSSRVKQLFLLALLSVLSQLEPLVARS